MTRVKRDSIHIGKLLFGCGDDCGLLTGHRRPLSRRRDGGNSRIHALSGSAQCLKAGKHTFVEKPLAMTSTQCTELIQAAKCRSLTLMVGHTFVYTTTVRKIKEIIDSGEIGELMYINCRRLNLGLLQKDVNIAWDLAPHDISIILFVVGANPIAVNCQGKAHVSPGQEDVTNISLFFRTASSRQSSPAGSILGKFGR